MRANWKLLVENSLDGYHGRTTHQRYLEFLIETGVDPELVRRRRRGIGKALGNGHAVIENEPQHGRPIARWTPMFGEAKRAELEAIHMRLAERFGPDVAYRMSLVGAMAEVGRRPTETAWIETHIFNSNKCFAYFLP